MVFRNNTKIKEYVNFKNNYVNIINPSLIKKENQFNIYPLIDNFENVEFFNKIIFMGKVYFEPNKFSLFDDKKLNQIKDDLYNDFINRQYFGRICKK